MNEKEPRVMEHIDAYVEQNSTWIQSSSKTMPTL